MLSWYKKVESHPRNPLRQKADTALPMANATAILAALGTCSSRAEQIDVLAQAWPRSNLLPADAKDLLVRLSQASSKKGQLQTLTMVDAERRTIMALDVAVTPILMQSPALRLVKKTVKKANTPNEVAYILDGLEEGCWLSAAQATELMGALTHIPAEKQFEYWHVVCSRVVDKWRLTEEEHTQARAGEGEGAQAGEGVGKREGRGRGARERMAREGGRG